MDDSLGLQSIAPFFYRHFFPYACAFEMATPSVRVPQTHGSQERPRGLSMTSRWAASIRDTLKAPIMDLFPDSPVSICISPHFSPCFAETNDVSQYEDPEATYTLHPEDTRRPLSSIEMYEAGRRRTPHSAPDSVDWPQPPSARKILPHAAQVQFSPTIPGRLREKTTLWRLITVSTDILLERWSTKLFTLGKIDDFKDAARTALTTTASDLKDISSRFVDDYTYLVQSRTLLDYFLTSIEGPGLWNLEESTITDFSFAKFLVAVIALMVRNFF